jgi:hypothetical protein
LLALFTTRLVGVEGSRQGKSGRQQPLSDATAQPPRTHLESGLRVAERPERIALDPSISETPALPAETPSPDARPSSGDAPPIGPMAKDEPRPITSAWPSAKSLLQQLSRLAEGGAAPGAWAAEVRRLVEQLAAAPSLADPQVAGILSRLAELADQSRTIAGSLESDDDRSQLLRAGFAVVRRLSIWEPAHRIAAQPPRPAAIVPSAVVLQLLARAEAELPRTGAAQPWRDYLLLDMVRTQFIGQGVPIEQRRLVAREVLYRMHSTQLSDVQADFLAEPVFRELAAALKTWASEAPDLAALLAAIEDYEELEQNAAAVRLAEIYDRLRWSTDPETARLAAAVNAYYRNANVRVAISVELVNRLLPEEQVTKEPVIDHIQGAYVEGQSQTSTRLRLVLLPVRGRWDIGLEANGEVASSTASSSGPATFLQNGWANYRARKRLTVDRRGIRLFQAEAEANADTQLNDFETDFDGIPLLGGLARAIARNQYEQKSPLARREVEGKIMYRASSQLDQEVARRIEKAKQDIQKQLLAPLQELNLEPTAVDMETTEQRLIARYRLAGRDQVSAYTPRPQAPGDSLLSVQIHESALNNALAHLKLNGRRVDLITLYQEMATRFNGKEITVPEDIPENIYVTFADEDPVRIDCENGGVRLTIRLKALAEKETIRWRNLTVRARYVPDADQLDANLVRDGIFELAGERNAEGDPLRTIDRTQLSLIFGKVLNRNRKVNLINERLAKSPKLKDQQVTQFVIHDGWIGVALGPQTPARQANGPQTTSR